MTLDVARARLHAQRLIAPLASPIAVVEHLVAVQSQDYYGAAWALGQRAKRTTAADIDRAYDRGDILRTHVLRPTWHFVTPGDARWLLELTAPRVQRLNAFWYKQSGLTAKKLAKTNTAIADALRGGNYLTRDELAKHVPGKPPMAQVMMHAELERVVISGPRRGKQFTYALFDERVPVAPAVPRDDALALLARRYVTSHGPAQVEDFRWWSGLVTADARRALELANLPVREVGTRRYYGTAPRRVALPDPTVHLLPNYDECLIAFADRTDAHDARVTKLEVVILGAHFVMSNGKLLGGWRRVADKKTTVVKCTLLAKPTKAELAALQAETARLATFLGAPARLELVRG